MPGGNQARMLRSCPSRRMHSIWVIRPTTLLLLALALLCLPVMHASAFENSTIRSPDAPDLIVITLNRVTVYSNAMHNGLILHAEENNVTMQIWDSGNFDDARSREQLQRAIDLPAEDQPLAYAIWPINDESRSQMQELHAKHNVGLIQVNQLPSEAEWPYLVAYAGPNDALRAENAAIMVIEALEERFSDPDERYNVIGLGYPDTYAGYHLSIEAFADRLLQSNASSLNLDLTERLPLDWGAQPAYDVMLELLNRYALVSGPFSNPNAAKVDNQGRLVKPKPVLHAIYNMDDRILMGAQQALVDLGATPGVDIILVGTVCNGARSLLEDGTQYGTTVQSPLLEGKLVVEVAKEYKEALESGETKLKEEIQFYPNPITKRDTWVDMFVDFLGEQSTVDQLCSWDQTYDRQAGPVKSTVENTNFLCDIADCVFIPSALFAGGYTLVGTNYFLATLSAGLLFYYRKKDLIRMAQPFFLAIVIAGSLVDTTSIVFMSRDNRDYSQQQLDQACMIWPVLLGIGHMVTTATLAAKIYRVKRLVDAGLTFRRVQVSLTEVVFFILFFVALDAIVLIVWFVTDPLTWQLDFTTYSANSIEYVNKVTGECRSDGDLLYSIFPLTLIFLHLSVLVYANYLAYKTSSYHDISDGKSIAICLFNSIQLLLIGTPIVALVEDSSETSYLIRVCIVFLNNFGVLVIVVLPKLYLCAIGQGDERPTMTSILGSTKKKSRGDVHVTPSSLRSGYEPPGNNSGVCGVSESVHSSPPDRNLAFSGNPNGSKSLPPDALYTVDSDSSGEGSDSRPQVGVQSSSTGKEEASNDSARSTTKLELGPQFNLTSILRNTSSRFVSDITEDVHEGSTFEALVDDSFLLSSSNKERPLYESSVVVEEQEDGSIVNCDHDDDELSSNRSVALPPALPLYDDDD